MTFPWRLIDPDGEGVYVLADDGGPVSILRTAAQALELDSPRDIDVQYVYLRECPDGVWRKVETGRHPRFWRLNLPRRWRPVHFAYCTPKAAA